MCLEITTNINFSLHFVRFEVDSDAKAILRLLVCLSTLGGGGGKKVTTTLNLAYVINSGTSFAHKS